MNLESIELVPSPKDSVVYDGPTQLREFAISNIRTIIGSETSL